MRACVIFNPAAKGDRARHFRRHIDLLGAQCAWKPTSGPGDGTRVAAKAIGEGFETVIAAGGDGTLNEVVNGIANAPDGLAKTQLGVLPLGTVNVFARELGVPLGLKPAWAVIRAGQEQRIDLPVAEFGPETRRQRRYFAQMAGAGLDARAVELVDWNWKKRIGSLAYIMAALRALFAPQPKIELQVGAARQTAELVLIGNGRFYGGRFVLFPKARLDDGLLDLCLFPKVNVATVSACSLGLLNRQVHKHGGALHVQAQAVTLTATSRVPLQVEGEAAGELPATFSLLPKALRVIVP